MIVNILLTVKDILLDDKWNARITDFGITRIKDLKDGVNKKHKENKSMGTIYWTAPEVFLDQGHTEKSDCTCTHIYKNIY